MLVQFQPARLGSLGPKVTRPEMWMRDGDELWPWYCLAPSNFTNPGFAGWPCFQQESTLHTFKLIFPADAPMNAVYGDDGVLYWAVNWDEPELDFPSGFPPGVLNQDL